MQPSYDADDFMRRGFFGSLIGFRKRSSSKPEPPLPPKFSAPAPPPPPPPSTHFQSSSSTVPPQVVHHLTVPHNRTEYDIYREIVSEAEYIERSSPTTPDFSCPTTPQPSNNYYTPLPLPQQFNPQFDPNLLIPQPPPQPEMMHHPSQYHMVMSPIAPHPIPVDTNGVPLGTQCPMAPPPYSSFAPQSSSGMPLQQQQMFAQMPTIPVDVKREIQEHLVLNGKQQMSIEDIVKMVVVALKDSQIEEGRAEEDESPEEILRRKRIQNNLAAARYRKRQREARDSAEQELGDLTKRNDELRLQVLRMEMEIKQLKQAVLGRP